MPTTIALHRRRQHQPRINQPRRCLDDSLSTSTGGASLRGHLPADAVGNASGHLVVCDLRFARRIDTRSGRGEANFALSGPYGRCWKVCLTRAMVAIIPVRLVQPSSECRACAQLNFARSKCRVSASVETRQLRPATHVRGTSNGPNANISAARRVLNQSFSLHTVPFRGRSSMSQSSCEAGSTLRVVSTSTYHVMST